MKFFIILITILSTLVVGILNEPPNEIFAVKTLCALRIIKKMKLDGYYIGGFPRALMSTLYGNTKKFNDFDIKLVSDGELEDKLFDKNLIGGRECGEGTDRCLMHLARKKLERIKIKDKSKQNECKDCSIDKDKVEICGIFIDLSVAKLGEKIKLVDFNVNAIAFNLKLYTGLKKVLAEKKTGNDAKLALKDYLLNEPLGIVDKLKAGKMNINNVNNVSRRRVAIMFNRGYVLDPQKIIKWAEDKSYESDLQEIKDKDRFKEYKKYITSLGVSDYVDYRRRLKK